MRSPIKPFAVEVKRAGRVSSRPAKNMWATVDDPSPELRHGRREADRAFAAAASAGASSVEATESKGRVLVAQGYRSPLELRLEQDEQERAGRRRGPRVKLPSAEGAPARVAVKPVAAPAPAVSTSSTKEAAEPAAPVATARVPHLAKRASSDVPRHERWKRRLRFQNPQSR